jgi:aspartate racemase
VLVPDAEGIELVHQVIYEELCLGLIRDESRAGYLRVMDDLAARGAQGIILGCTEITLLIKPEYTGLPLYDTTLLHALAAVDWALA